MVVISAGTLLQTQNLYSILILLRTAYLFSVQSTPSITDIEAVLMKLCQKITVVWDFLGHYVQ